MKLSSLSAAIQDYCRITGETVNNYDYTEYVNGMFFNPTTNKYMIVLPSNEFAIFAIGEREGLSYLHLDQCYGFMKNFTPYIKDFMQAANLEWIVTATQRDPKAHIKKWRMKRMPSFDYDYQGRHYFVLQGHISNLK